MEGVCVGCLLIPISIDPRPPRPREGTFGIFINRRREQRLPAEPAEHRALWAALGSQISSGWAESAGSPKAPLKAFLGHRRAPTFLGAYQNLDPAFPHTLSANESIQTNPIPFTRIYGLQTRDVNPYTWDPLNTCWWGHRGNSN